MIMCSVPGTSHIVATMAVPPPHSAHANASTSSRRNMLTWYRCAGPSFSMVHSARSLAASCVWSTGQKTSKQHGLAHSSAWPLSLPLDPHMVLYTTASLLNKSMFTTIQIAPKDAALTLYIISCIAIGFIASPFRRNCDFFFWNSICCFQPGRLCCIAFENPLILALEIHKWHSNCGAGRERTCVALAACVSTNE